MTFLYSHSAKDFRRKLFNRIRLINQQLKKKNNKLVFYQQAPLSKMINGKNVNKPKMRGTSTLRKILIKVSLQKKKKKFAQLQMNKIRIQNKNKTLILDLHAWINKFPNLKHEKLIYNQSEYAITSTIFLHALLQIYKNKSKQSLTNNIKNNFHSLLIRNTRVS